MSGGLLVLGDVVTDVVAVHREPPAPATDTAAVIRILPGGAGANVACWAAHAGLADVGLLARVGADRSGWHEEFLLRAGVRPRLVVDSCAPTATVVSLVDASAGAERSFLTDSGATLRLCRADWSPDLLDGVAHLHVSGYLFFAEASRELALIALRDARSRGVPASVDPASAGFIADFGVSRFLAAVEGVSMLLPNRDEARLLTGLPDPVDAAAKLSRHVPLVVSTQGAQGALVAESGAVTARIPAVSAQAVDSTGAGDAFTGALLAALLSGCGPVAAAEEGCRAGAEAVAGMGGRPRAGETAPGRR
ncbi:sugar kinase [Streptomyces sp. NPDC051219]|uniref:carbohydrate kinase family protein n=1 Tax=Streptomyces sp. NPDC051219 TaxID=3155283 RepID=UPI0034312CEF